MSPDAREQLRESIAHHLFDEIIRNEREHWENDHPASEPYDPETEWDDFWREEYYPLADRILALPELAALLDPQRTPDVPEFTLCEVHGVLDVGGACPIHGGDSCLRQFVSRGANPPRMALKEIPRPEVDWSDIAGLQETILRMSDEDESP